MKKFIIATGFIVAMLQSKAQTEQDGNNYLYYERYASAENTFSQLTKTNPEDAAAWFGLIKTYLLSDADSAALATLQKAPVTLQEEPLYEVAKGWVLLATEENNEATLLFDKALHQTKEKNPTVLSAIAQAQIDAKSGNGLYAVELLKKAIKRDKHNAELYVALGDAYRKLGNGSEAYLAYKKALEENDKYAAAYHSLGQIFLTQKNPDMYVDYFNKAITADSTYAPSLYKLYLHEFYYNPAAAMTYYKSFMAHSDASVQNEYDLIDLLFLNKDYSAAIQKAKMLEQKEGKNLQPRIYKLIGYSYAGMKDSTEATTYLQKYFAAAPDSQVIAKDYEIMSQLYASNHNDSLAKIYLITATEKETDTASLLTNYKKLANMAKQNNNPVEEAKWLEAYYVNNKKANNVDLYYWALAHYMGAEYSKADSVFGLYTAKYPTQGFGYYWQARSQSLLDKNMEKGLAVPTYHKLIEVLENDSTDANYKKWMVEAYSYLAAYEANKEKDYAQAADYFGKVLEVDPENADAKKYIAILEKQIEK